MSQQSAQGSIRGGENSRQSHISSSSRSVGGKQTKWAGIDGIGAVPEESHENDSPLAGVDSMSTSRSDPSTAVNEEAQDHQSHKMDEDIFSSPLGKESLQSPISFASASRHSLNNGVEDTPQPSPPPLTTMVQSPVL